MAILRWGVGVEHSKDPFRYLRNVLAKLPTMTTKDDLSPLLPRH